MLRICVGNEGVDPRGSVAEKLDCSRGSISDRGVENSSVVGNLGSRQSELARKGDDQIAATKATVDRRQFDPGAGVHWDRDAGRVRYCVDRLARRSRLHNVTSIRSHCPDQPSRAVCSVRALGSERISRRWAREENAGRDHHRRRCEQRGRPTPTPVMHVKCPSPPVCPRLVGSDAFRAPSRVTKPLVGFVTAVSTRPAINPSTRDAERSNWTDVRIVARFSRRREVIGCFCNAPTDLVCRRCCDNST